MKPLLLSLLLVALLGRIIPAVAGEYQILRVQEGPFAFTASIGATFNKGSSLQREIILLNDPDAPLQVAQAATRFELAKSNFSFVPAMQFEARAKVQAISIRHIAYDAFNRHLESLASTEVLDREAGRHSKEARWNSVGELVPDLVTTVVYVARVRLGDGTQWAYDEGHLQAAVGKLGLEVPPNDLQRPDSSRPQ
jgi:hypothetical protein